MTLWQTYTTPGYVLVPKEGKGTFNTTMKETWVGYLFSRNLARTVGSELGSRNFFPAGFRRGLFARAPTDAYFARVKGAIPREPDPSTRYIAPAIVCGVMPSEFKTATCVYLAILIYVCRKIPGPIPPTIAVESPDDYQRWSMTLHTNSPPECRVQRADQRTPTRVPRARG